MRIPLTQGKFAVIDDEDYTKELTTTVCGERVTVRICDRKWYSMLHHSGNFYAITTTRLRDGRRRILFLHRLILGIPPDSKLQCDHINRDSLDNRRENLRWVTNKQSQWNRSSLKYSTSNYIGVSWHKESRRWQASLRFEGKQYHIGRFNNEVDAAIAYDKKKRELCNGFSCGLNFPERQ